MFNLLSLPPELRERIYEHFYAPNTTGVTLLLCKGPDQSLRATCRLVHTESEKAYNRAYIKFSHARAVLLEHLLGRAQALANQFFAGSPRLYGLHAALTRLTRGALPDYAHTRCRHKCERHDSYYCDCQEHEKCSNCGRWLALAVYFDLHPAATTPQLVKEYPDTNLTHLGEIVYAKIPKIKVGRICEASKNYAERYPPMGECQRFGEYWWRFELERQWMLHGDMRFLEPDEKRCFKASPREGLRLQDWDMLLARNGARPSVWRELRMAKMADMARKGEKHKDRRSWTACEVM